MGLFDRKTTRRGLFGFLDREPKVQAVPHQKEPEPREVLQALKPQSRESVLAFIDKLAASRKR